ncbi:MAG: hypothetical protein ACE5IB_01070 [Candidatus Geothermarchaeales archaeon]
MTDEDLSITLLRRCKRCGNLVEKTVRLSQAELNDRLSSRTWVEGEKPNLYETEGLCKVCRTVYEDSYLRRTRRS